MRKIFALAFIFLIFGFWFVGSYNSGYGNYHSSYYPTYGSYGYAHSYYYPTNVYYNYNSRPFYGSFHW